MKKTCIKCKKEKSLSEFYISYNTSGVHKRECAECTKLRNKRYKDENKKKFQIYHREHGKSETSNLSDYYVKRKISRILKGISLHLIPQEYVELKRIQLKLYREIYK